MQNYSSCYSFVKGGDTRQESISNALNIIDSEYIMVTDVARASIPKDIILDLIKKEGLELLNWSSKANEIKNNPKIHIN